MLTLNMFYKKIVNLSPRIKKLILVTIDLINFILAILLSLAILENEITNNLIFFYFYIQTLIITFFFKFYSYPIRLTDEIFFIRILLIQLISFMILIVLSYLLNLTYSYSLFILIVIINLIFINFSRILLVFILNKLKNYSLTKKLVVIYGAGEAGKKLLFNIERNKTYKVLCFLDDDKLLHGKYIKNYLVKGDYKVVSSLSKNNNIIILLSIPQLSVDRKQFLINYFFEKNIQIKSIPSLEELINNKKNISNLRTFEIEDLIKRKKQLPIKNLINSVVKDHNILITGAGGSIGSALCVEIIKYNPKKLFLLDNSEINLFNLKNKINNINTKIDIKLILGSINNILFLEDIFKSNKIDSVYHAAAYKHVELVEENIFQSLQNNVIGTYNIGNISSKYKVKYFTHISTDKAVEPSSYMGLSKKISENLILLLQKNINKNNLLTKFSIVRFGNVLGSSGSAIQIFKKQIASGGPVTVTDPKATRYFMTINEAVELVLQCASIKSEDEIFILDMGEPVNILEIAKKIIYLSGYVYVLNPKGNNNQDISNQIIPIKIIGLKKGEKVNEKLSENNIYKSTIHPKIFLTQVKFKKYSNIEELVNNVKNIIADQDSNKLQHFFD